jgi:penicillin V acylase-like amidase (Ntn superfamily)
MCTEFFLLTNENNLLSGRTFDFPFNPQYKINHTEKNTLIPLIHKNESLKNNPIKSLYNFMTLYVYNDTKIITDGMNEEKLIVNSLWLEEKKQ